MSARGTLTAWSLGLSLALAGAGAHAGPLIDATIDFDNVADGAAANAALGSLASLMRFANPDIEADVDADGNETGGFHWFDATSLYGDVLVRASAAAVSGANVLSNALQPIMLVFAAPVDIAGFSIQQDLSGFGNLQAEGSSLVFLDAEGHEMSGSSVSYTQGGQPGLTVQAGGRVDNVYAILLAGGVDYDNLRITTVDGSSVPEPGTAALWVLGLGGLAFASRRRKG